MNSCVHEFKVHLTPKMTLIWIESTLKATENAVESSLTYLFFDIRDNQGIVIRKRNT